MDVDAASLKEILWHRMRSDLARYFPAVLQSDTLMCCTCARFLKFEDFTIEHIIPRQSLADDPKEVRSAITANQRSGNLLLCNKALKIKGRQFYPKGCNSYKGKFYDPRLREVFNRAAFDPATRINKFDSRHHIATTCAGYLAIRLSSGTYSSWTLNAPSILLASEI